MEGEGTLSGVSCTRLHDHCDLTCTFSLLRREGHDDLSVLKQRMAGIKAFNVQWNSSLEMNYPGSLSFGVLWWDMTQGLLLPEVPLPLTFRKLETTVTEHNVWGFLFSKSDVGWELRNIYPSIHSSIQPSIHPSTGSQRNRWNDRDVWTLHYVLAGTVLKSHAGSTFGLSHQNYLVRPGISFFSAKITMPFMYRM